MEKKTYGILDIAKFISALLVIAIHCAPFIQVDESVNFVFVQIFARLAVPFFFITSGWLFFRKIDPKQGMKDINNVSALKHYWFRIFKIYVIWSVLYLPLMIVTWIQGGFDLNSIIRLIRDFLFNGTYYHLWFLPALLMGIPFIYVLYTKLQKHWMLWISLTLYVMGMMINVYGNTLLEVPVIGSIIQGYESILVTSRNGIFFAPIYLSLGIYVQDFLQGNFKKQSGIAFLISFGLFCGEAYLLRHCNIMHDLTSMYLMLLPTVFFLFMFLMQFHLKEQPIFSTLRKMSLLIYVSHIYFIFIFLNVLGLPNLLVYVLTILCSCSCSFILIQLSKKDARWKALM